MTRTRSKGKFYVKAGAIIVGVLLAIMMGVGIWKFGTVFSFIYVWRWMAHKLTDTTGMDIWLARGLSALLVIPFVYIISMVFSWNKSKRQAGIALLAVTTAIICFGMFYISQDMYFSFKTGEAMKYYIITPQGDYKFNSSPGYDPVWGKKYEKVTLEVIDRHNIQNEKMNLVGLPAEQYFDPKSGRAVKWYAILPNSSIEILPYPGFHPKFGIKLQPVTPEIIQKLENERIEKEQASTPAVRSEEPDVTAVTGGAPPPTPSLEVPDGYIEKWGGIVDGRTRTSLTYKEVASGDWLIYNCNGVELTVEGGKEPSLAKAQGRIAEIPFCEIVPGWVVTPLNKDLHIVLESKVGPKEVKIIKKVRD